MSEDRIRERLLAEQHRADERVARLEAELQQLTRARRSESDDDEHDPEGETLSAQWSLRSGILDSARDTSRQAHAALDRLDDGTYGVCAVCGKAIPEEQLDVRPFRDRCVACVS